MAGRGPAPKDRDQRAGHLVPKRGEWLDLPKTRKGPIPKLPKRDRGWAARTTKAWNAWWRDPAATQWTPADVDNVLYLAELMDLDPVKLAGEIRLRMDGLGLTQTGKRNMRWRVGEETAVPVTRTGPSTQFDGLKLVGDDAVSA